MTYSKKSDCVNLDVNANVIELDQELVEWIDEETPSMSIPAISFPFAPMQISSECMELLALNTLSKNNNTNCTYNARSPHLKCTVNPTGSCDGCKDFEEIESKDFFDDLCRKLGISPTAFERSANEIGRAFRRDGAWLAESRSSGVTLRFDDLRSGRFDELEQVVGKSNVATLISHKLNEPILVESKAQGLEEVDFCNLL
jgi:Family of unknown function (DUF6464)